MHLPAKAAQGLRVVQHLGPDHLQGDDLVGARIHRLVDLADAAFAESIENAIRPARQSVHLALEHQVHLVDREPAPLHELLRHASWIGESRLDETLELLELVGVQQPEVRQPFNEGTNGVDGHAAWKGSGLAKEYSRILSRRCRLSKTPRCGWVKETSCRCHRREHRAWASPSASSAGGCRIVRTGHTAGS